MKPNREFLNLEKKFWANVRLISQKVGYTERPRRQGRARRPSDSSLKRECGPVKVPDLEDIKRALEDMQLKWTHLVDANDRLTDLGARLMRYFKFRAKMLNEDVEPRLMDKVRARAMFERIHEKVCPKCPLPMNKQKGTKKAHAFLTGIVNMLIEANADGHPCDYDPRELTTVTFEGEPLRTLARRVDGAFPGPVNPIAVWEIKEYYYTTTFGSRVADGVYETLLDGIELEDLRSCGVPVHHYLMIDDHFTWWQCGRSYLCRVIDMLHMGYVDEVLFGAEVEERIPILVRQWVKAARKRPKSIKPPAIDGTESRNPN